MQQMRVKFAFKESENDDDEWSTNHGSVNSDYEYRTYFHNDF